ncbi:hypothetical protein CsatA_023141 [Cannabis sativa]
MLSVIVVSFRRNLENGYDDLRTIMDSSGVDVWTLIDTAIAVASKDYDSNLKKHRDSIVERLYTATGTSSAPTTAYLGLSWLVCLVQSEDSLVGLLQGLVDMDITFQSLKKTDIRRHVNRLRKHSSSEVRRLVKQLVRF